MRLEAWRIVKARHAPEAFSGEGPRRYGGRWTSPGVAVVYAAEHASLAVLEMLNIPVEDYLDNKYSDATGKLDILSI